MPVYFVFVFGNAPLLTLLRCFFLSLQALNNVQSTHAGFGYVNSTNVFKASVLLFRIVSLC